ncbi:MAG: Na(+)/H(+) antiporter subunit D [bacterium]
MIDFWIHPAVILLLGAILLPLVPASLRKGWLLLIPALVFARVLGLEQGTFGEVPFLKWTLTFGRVDRLSLVFGYIMSLTCLISTLYGLHVKEPGQHVASWTYAAGSIGAIFAGDYLTLFLFWEIMALSSVFLVWYRREPGSLAAGFRYLLVHTAGGLSLLAGIILLGMGPGGSLAFNAFDVHNPTAATWLILGGFILNAAVPPLHSWLPDAYSRGTFNGSVFLSAFTTKTAVYALCRGFAGMEVLVVLGVIMTLYGVVYAVIENDVRRLFAYHIVSQVGYMVAAVGIGTDMAINGACAHAFAHILYKGLLFMGGGTILHMTGKSKFTELGGLYKKMPWTFLFTLIGGLSISGFPLLSGFISKSMIVQAGFEQHLYWAGFLLNLAAIGTFYCNGLKVPYLVWFGRNNCSAETENRAKDPPWNMMAAMGVTSALCFFIGCYTPFLYDMLPRLGVEYHPFTSYHLSESLQILLFTALAFFILVRLGKVEPHDTISLDTDWFYRMGGRAVLWLAQKPVQAVDTFVGEVYRLGGIAGLMSTARSSGDFDNKVVDGAVDGLAATVAGVGHRMKTLQRGQMQQSLAIAFAVAAVLMIGFLVFANGWLK